MLNVVMRRAILSGTLGLALILGVNVLLTWSDGVATHGREIGVETVTDAIGKPVMYVHLVRVRSHGSVHIEARASHSDDTGPRIETEAWGDGRLRQVAGQLLVDMATPWMLGERPAPAPGESDQIAIVARGWPWPAFWHAYEHNRSKDPMNNDPGRWSTHPVAAAFDAPGGVRLGTSTVAYGLAARSMPRALAYRPVWPGLLGNWLVYGGACFLAFSALSLGKARVRRRRGACVRCGFDLAGLSPEDACPECGLGRGARSASDRDDP